jgi:general secretion pathway protein B
MSFILDALKKSEAERQRQGAPGFASVPDSSTRKSSRKWIWMVAILLCVNLVALMGVLYLASGDVETTASTVPIDIDRGNADQSATSFSDLVAEAKRTQPERSGSTSAPATTSEQPMAETPAASSVSESYSTFNELRAGGAFSLPDLHLDIHVYSGQPTERFVFINMTKYKESATLKEGPVVKQITSDGVVLGYQGTDFLLPRE